MRNDDESRCYINHVVAQHRRLHMMLGRIRTTVLVSVQPDERPSFAEGVRILQSLRKEMVHHFAEEQAGGCLEEAVSRCPSLAGACKRIESAHAAILEQIDGLIAHVETLTRRPQDQGAIQRLFTDLHDTLLDHEAAENGLLAQGFGKFIDQDESTRPTMIFDN